MRGAGAGERQTAVERQIAHPALQAVSTPPGRRRWVLSSRGVGQQASAGAVGPAAVMAQGQGWHVQLDGRASGVHGAPGC